MVRDLHDPLVVQMFPPRLRELQKRARARTLTDAERAEYEKQRGDIVGMLHFAQQLTRAPQQIFRKTLRVSVTVPVDVDHDERPGTERGTTVDLSAGGFAANLAAPRSVGKVVGYVLHLGAGERIEGRARVASVRAPQGGMQRASFAFESMPPELVERVQIAVFDVVLGEQRTNDPG
jgi:c-di-GMP-binding flagellar brake protein YcgR